MTVSNTQRALWTFLMYTFIAPFFGAVAVTVGALIAKAVGFTSLLPETPPPLGALAIESYVWSIIPAVLTALALVPIAFRSAQVGWIVVAVAGAVSFAIASVLFPIEPETARPYLAFLAGLVAIAVREVLVRAGAITA